MANEYPLPPMAELATLAGALDTFEASAKVLNVAFIEAFPGAFTVGSFSHESECASAFFEAIDKWRGERPTVEVIYWLVSASGAYVAKLLSDVIADSRIAK